MVTVDNGWDGADDLAGVVDDRVSGRITDNVQVFAEVLVCF